MAYKITGFLKHSELDNYQEGCSGNGRQSYFVDCKIKADTLQELKSKCEDFVGAPMLGDMIETNRLDFQRMENDEGEAPSKAEQEQFEAGEIDLWLCDYSCVVEIVQDVQYADVSELFKGQ